MYRHFLPLGYSLVICINVVVTNNKNQKVLGKLSLPVKCRRNTHIIDFVVISSLGPGFILGIYFCKKFDVTPRVFLPKVTNN